MRYSYNDSRQIYSRPAKWKAVGWLRMVYIGSFLFWIYPVIAQDGGFGTPLDDYLESSFEERPFSEESWQKATEGLDYSRVKKGNKGREKGSGEGEGRRGESRDRNYDRNFGGDAGPIMKILLIIIGAVLLAILIANLLGLKRPRNKKVKKGTAASIAAIEENIHEAEIDAFILQALNEKDYNLAIRLYYLNILKALSLQKRIRWKKDKTNRAYLWEMQKTPYFEEFRWCTYLFDRVRYSGTPLKEADFLEIEPRFKLLLASVQQPVTS